MPTFEPQYTAGDILSPKQEERIDFLHNKAYEVMCELMGKELDWDMEWIGELCDDLCNHAIQFHGAKEEEFYPYIAE